MRNSSQRKKNHHKRILAALIAIYGVCVLTACFLEVEDSSISER